jgi:NAD(P)-dependent dehydrogenase (short-subunit alcohol dehydrogenase family)
MIASSKQDSERVALVTGAGRPNGLGAAIVRELAGRGVRVVVADVLNETWGKPDLPNEPSVDFVEADLNDIGSCQSVIDHVYSEYGRFDIVINNAAQPQGADRREIGSVPLEAFEAVLNVGLRAPFMFMKAAVPLMRERKWGRIVNISSIDGLTPKPTRGAYCTSKSGIIALTRSVALDVAKDGITANCVCPGSMKTARAINTAKRRLAAGAVLSEDEAYQAEIARIPIGRFGTVDEVAKIVSFLASDGAGYVTAEAWPVHGGQLFTGFLAT